MTDTTQPPAETLAEAREAAALAFDARVRKAGHPTTVTMERHHAKVIRAGEGDEYDAVQAAVIALTRRAGGVAGAVERLAIREFLIVCADAADLQGTRYAPSDRRSLIECRAEAKAYRNAARMIFEQDHSSYRPAALALPAPVVEGEIASTLHDCSRALRGMEIAWSSMTTAAPEHAQQHEAMASQYRALADRCDAALSEGRSHG